MRADSQPGRSILIVDPDQSIRTLLETVLARAGFRTASADELDEREASRFAAILRDLNLAPSARGALSVSRRRRRSCCGARS